MLWPPLLKTRCCFPASPAASFPGLSPGVPWPMPVVAVLPVSLTCSAPSPCPSLQSPYPGTSSLVLSGCSLIWSLSFSVHRVYLQLLIWSLFLIGGEEAKRESQKCCKGTLSWVLWQKGLGNSWGRQNCLWTQLNFLFLLQKTAFTLVLLILKLSSAVICKIILPSFPLSPSLSLCPWTLSPCAKLSLGCAGVSL